MRIAVVVPIYQEEKNIIPLYNELEATTRTLAGIQFEYVFVNDGSKDNSLLELRSLASRDQKVKIINLSRNFGKEIALTAGVDSVDCDAVICMDADLQHPPALIPRLIELWKEGNDVVAAIRVGMEGQPLLRRIGSFGYYWLMSRITKLDMAEKSTDFRLCDRKVIEAFHQFTEKNRLFRGIIDWLGFKKAYIEFKAPARMDEKISYSYSKLWQLAINSITSFSLFPLKLITYLGAIIAFGASVLLIWMLVADFLFSFSHFTPLAIFVVINTFLMGIVLMGLGLIALYIGTIHTEVINRPLYIISDRINFSQETDNSNGNQ